MSKQWDTVLSERNNEERRGRMVAGSYGKDFELDEEGNERAKPRIVRGRGRPSATAGVKEYLWPDELQKFQIENSKNQELAEDLT